MDRWHRLGCVRAGQWVGCVKSTIGKWLRRTPLQEPQLLGGVPERDGLWTRTHAGGTELKVIQGAATSVALRPFGRWAKVIDRAWQLGAQVPRHPVGDGDAAIAAGIDPVYGRGVPHQLCVFHLRREYWRNLGQSALLKRSGAAVGEFGGRAGMGVAAGAINRWGGGVGVREIIIQRAAAFGDGADQASDAVAFGVP